MSDQNPRRKSLNRGARATAALSLCLAGSFSGCDNQIVSEHGLTSLRISMVSPRENELGSPTQAVKPTSMRFDVEALDEKGAILPMNGQVEAFLVAGGTRL